MASRKEEKERLRREREEAERAAQASEGRRKRIAAVLGAVLVAAVALIVVLAVASGDDEGNNQTQGGDQALPAQRISDLDEAAEAAGCRVADHESEGRQHLGDPEQTVEYKTNPPTSGTHDPVAAQDGVYPEPPDLEQSVHSLEHGRVNIQYRAGTPANRVNQLETLFNEEVQGQSGYHTLLFENQSRMTAAVAATGWTHSLTCPELNDRVFDAIRAFREKMIVGDWQQDIPELQP